MAWLVLNMVCFEGFASGRVLMQTEILLVLIRTINNLGYQHA